MLFNYVTQLYQNNNLMQCRMKWAVAVETHTPPLEDIILVSHTGKIFNGHVWEIKIMPFSGGDVFQLEYP